MKIAPIDIAHKTFSRKMMGFDANEVMTFLREVADEMEALIRDRNQLKEHIRDKEVSINEFRERDELLKQTITTATKMSENLQKDAEREAKIIIGDAEHKAELIIADARDSLKKIYEEISTLKRVRMQFENNLKALVQSHLTMLSQGREVMPNPEVPNMEMSASHQRTQEMDVKSKVHEAVNTAIKSPSIDL
ncbi:MAG: DivIVA domain-containing protein [Bdellovibrionales bacterium]|nr:DivIVA domain-containing protein [Bdellovibrionales bacterium]